MLRAATLVHKGGMEIGLHAISTFARHFAKTYSLAIHTDPSTDDEDHRYLLQAAAGMEVRIVSAKERGEKVDHCLRPYPMTKDFLSRASYFAKLEIPMFEEEPYFFFDSDVVWLRPVTNLAPVGTANAFSTESWSWYNGIVNDRLWIKAQTPRRVNSGFHYIGEKFPYEKMENMLANKMFDRTMQFAGDQEIFAYLFNDMQYYHPKDLKRSRVLSTYNLKEDSSAALHFPGKMWAQHIDQIKNLADANERLAVKVRYQSAVPLDATELLRMRLQIKVGKSTLLAQPLNLIRKLRRAQ